MPGFLSLVSVRMLVLLGAVVTFSIAAPKSATAHEATFRGLVLATLPTKGEVVIRHGPMFGGPPAIETFRASARDLRAVRVGESIDATADADSTPWTVSHIRNRGKESLTGAPAEDAGDGSQILRDVHHVVVGEYAPTPALIDERGHAFSLRDLRGRAVVMAFVYTRCRDLRECPLITSRFHELQELVRGTPVHLLEITLDPGYDRPGVLARYGRTFGEDPARWTLATGDPDTVLNFAAQFEVTAFPDHRVGLIHPEKTVILDRYGAIRELIDEGAWTPGEIEAAVQHDERLASNPFERLDLWLSSAAVSVCGNAVAGFSGFTDLLTVIAIAAFFTFLLWRVGRSIAKGAA